MNRGFSGIFWMSVFCLVVQFAHSQERKLGTWKMFMPYHSSHGMCDAGDKVFCAAAQSIFSCEKNTGTIQTYDKATGLSDVGVKLIGYDPATKTLIVAYNNSNLDLITNGTDVFNIPDIKNKSTSGSISIYGISFYNGNAYVSTDVGISVINLAKKEISNTYIIGSSGGPVKVSATSIDGTKIYAATVDGVKHASLTSSNLLDYNSWTLYTGAQNLPQQKASLVTAYNNKVYAVIGGGGTDTLYEYDGSSWKKIFDSTSNTIQTLEVVNGILYFSIWNDNGGATGILGKIDMQDSLFMRVAKEHIRPLNWFESNGISWEADFYNGLYKNTQGNMENIIPDGPFSSNVFGIEAKNGVVNVCPGGVDDSWGLNWNFDGFFTYKNNKWGYRNQYTDPSLLGNGNFSDFLSSATVPARGVTYYGSFLSGLIELDNNTGGLKHYDKTNSLLEGTKGDTARTKISVVSADRNGNVWIGNSGADHPIKVIRSDGTWKQFDLNYSFSLMKKIIIDQNNQLWAPIRPNGLLVWSYGADMDNTSDDQWKVLKAGQGSGGLPDENVYSIAEDQDGNIWVGTNAGIAVYYCAGSVLSQSGCDADQIKVVAADGYVGYLFGTESIRAIAVDAANRKWIGTTNGVWLVSADGKTQLLNFNSSNSPMPVNQVTDIAIDDATGEVFVGTLGGMVSYQGDAVGLCTDCNCDGAIVYPNPVKHDYTGPIAIKGVTENGYVKITDAAGLLVFQGRANGTQMIWDGNKYNGTRAKSGVYIVYSSTDLGDEKCVSKILLMN